MVSTMNSSFIDKASASVISQIGSNIYSDVSPLSIDDIIFKIINQALILIFISAVIAVLYGGIKYITANGNDSAAEQGRSTLLFAVLGLILAVFGFVILHVIADSLTRVVHFVLPAEARIKLSDFLGDPSNGYNNVNSLKSLTDNIGLVITDKITFYGAIAAFASVLWSSFTYITSFGDSSKAEKAKKGLIFCVVGFFFMLIAWAITQGLINEALGMP